MSAIIGKEEDRAAPGAPELSLGPAEEPTKEQPAPRVPSLYWQPLVQEFIDTPARRFTVIHLVNPSPDDLIEKTMLPYAVNKVTVRILSEAGTRVERIGIVRPDSATPDQALLPEPKRTDAGVEVVVPRIAVWAMVIVEESGKFAVPADLPHFSDPPNAAEVAAARAQAATALTNDPLQPPAVGLKLEANEQMFETDTGYNSVPAQEAADADAYNGRAQVRDDHVKSVYFGRSWLGPLQPGRYQARMRVKLMDNRQPARRQTARMSLYINTRQGQQNRDLPGFSSDEGTPPERRLIVDGKYRDYVLGEIDLRQETAFIHLIGGAAADDPDGNRFYCDHFVIKQLDRYTDAQLAGWNPVAKPAGLRAPQGRAPQKILQVRGLYWQFYGAEKQLAGCAGAYALPEKYEDLYAYDAVVLTNLDMLGSAFQTRRMLRDFAEDGGRLVILGGPAALGQGGFPGTCLEEILPFALQPPGAEAEVAPCRPPLLLGPKPGQPRDDKPALLWRHQMKRKDGAEVLAYAGDAPIAARLAVGKGLVCVFAGTVLGDPPAAVTPFWACASWAELLRQLAVK